MSRPTLHFWFEFASTYSYLSAMRVEKMAEDAGVDLEWHPFWLGPIFHAQGWTSSPFNLYPVKGAYMWRDMARLCADRGLPLVQPDPFPQNGVLAARVALLALAQDAAKGAAYVTSVYRAEFGEGRQISDPELIAELLAQSGLPADLIEQAGGDAAKQALKDKVAEAMDLGLFGAPSFIAKGEVFWGDDRLENAIAHLKAV
ncbi:2-hydroxychromene-2-carboxylate isomerase [Arenibacterium halophilum]|uniref:2-hydroxychromene-2-carboxylate isomerase n=1 Tax=Arenibacterium halophilum TaxID=2583821 RepID=A0ABY2XBR3_9RHOB|nr:2-hydroxychromene-2-carboxylate isomerase [Arenibacterium halophilum]TMV13428.1 2-hydroxychromene-2-carboxylate isomerase [Arenibacterium halophilum]